MKRSRVLGLAAAGLVIGVAACVLLIPYFNHLIFPYALPATLGQTIPNSNRQEVSVDALGAADHIRSEADARAYVEALIDLRLDGTPIPGLAQFEDRLARAEYQAVFDPKKRIPESLVAKTFNRMMDDWQMPDWGRVSVEELHAFRMAMSSAMYPQSVTRLPDGSIAPDCRPTEALFILDLLNSNGGVPPWIREGIRATHWPWKFLKRSRHPRPINAPPIKYTLRPLGPEFFHRPEQLRMEKFSKAEEKYFASHPGLSFQQWANDLFSQLGIN